MKPLELAMGGAAFAEATRCLEYDEFIPIRGTHIATRERNTMLLKQAKARAPALKVAAHTLARVVQVHANDAMGPVHNGASLLPLPTQVIA